jgi:ribosome maturation factor RimP
MEKKVEQIRPILADKCSDLGFELFEVRFFRAGSRAILRMFIDSPQGVTIADCEKVSNTLSDILDVENFLNARPYTLEVSSLGIDRPLKTARDFRRIIGKEVTVHMDAAFTGKLQHTGIIKECSETTLTLDCDNETVHLPLTLITSGKESVRFK